MADVKTLNTVAGYSTVSDKEILDFEHVHGAHHYGRLDLVVRRAEGVWLHTQDGKKYLDCLAAYSAANQGHCHPKITRALVEALQGQYASVISNVVYTDALGLFLKKLSTMVPQLAPSMPAKGNKVLPKNGGVESVETAVKAARAWGNIHKGVADGKQEIIVFTNNFHGRTLLAVSASSIEKYKKGFGPLIPGFVDVEFGNLDAVKKAINKNTCAILVEPMQGEGGMYQPPD